MQNVQPQADFESLAALPEFASFSEILTKLTGISMSLQSPEGDVRVRYGDGIRNPLCYRIRATKTGSGRCVACDFKHNRKAGANGKSILYTCHAGFLDMIVPIFVRGVHVASISSGQLLAAPPSKSELSKLKRRLAYLKMEDGAFCRAYRSAPYVPKAKVKHMMRLLELFGVHLCESLDKIRELESRLERNEVRKAKEFVARNFADPNLGLVETAVYAGLSPSHFSYVFKQSTGISITRYIQRVRVDEAKQLLRHSETTITETCFRCGFNSMVHFNRVFRALERKTPSGFTLSSRNLSPARKPYRQKPQASI